MIELTQTTREDLESLFVFQSNAEGIWMAAFTAQNPTDKDFYMNKWSQIIANPDISMQTIRLNNQIVGSVIHFDMMGKTHVSYWIDRPYWGKGIATQGLQLFIAGVAKRPLYGHTAYDNVGSQRVLEKCGFTLIAKEKGFANARNMEIEEFVYQLL